MIELGVSSQTYTNSSALKTYGQKKKVPSEQVREVDAILQDDALGLDRKALTWDQLVTKVGADVCGCTMHKIMSDALDYKKHLACMKRWLSNCAKAYRQKQATMMYKKYPKLEDWHCICFSNEVHFGYELKKQLQIIWCPSTRYYYDCI